MTSPTSDAARIQHIFFPHTEVKLREAKGSGARFAYYTTADTASKILKARQVWLRNALAMNDYSEFDHGLACLKAAYNSEPGNALNTILNVCFGGLADEVRNHFDAWLPSIEFNTYMLCLSQHSPEEDSHGRLSMWRAYGDKSGVALVLKSAALFIESDALGAYASPVAYLSPDAFAGEVMKVARNIEGELEFVQSLGRDTIKQTMFNALRFAVLCTKHPGFHEEQEWRVIASPAMYPSKFLIEEIEVVRGAPQTVLKIDLRNHPEASVLGLSVPDLLDRVIIGPCEYPVVTLSAFRRLLSDAGVSEPETRVTVSGIPLRYA